MAIRSALAQSVTSEIARYFPATLELATLGTIFGTLVGVPAGVLAATRPGSIADQIVRVVGLMGYSMPVFWLGLIGLLVFYGQLDWVAGPGRLDPTYDMMMEFTLTSYTGMILIDAALNGAWDVFANAVSHIILPAGLLGYVSMAYISRMTRSFMMNELGQEYITTARVKGMPEWRVIWVHAMKNVLVPLITVIALSYAYLLEGSVLTETIFAWPGLGSYITDALFANDMPAVLGGTVVVGVVFVTLEHGVRHPVPAGRPKGARMTALRDWLSDPNPASRRQARLGQLWLAWQRIRRNRLAMAGLVIVAVLLIVAALAPVDRPA